MNTVRLILLFGAITAVGCSSTERSSTSELPDTAKRISNVQDVLAEKFTVSERIFFRSWDGRWIGTDCDTEIELHADGHAILTEYGDAIDKYDGTYSVTADAEGTLSELTLSLNGYGTWPVMTVYVDRSELLLMPIDNAARFKFGNRGGATLPGGTGSFWPFRQIP